MEYIIRLIFPRVFPRVTVRPLPVFSSMRRHIGITSAIKGCREGVRKTTMRGTSLRATSPADRRESSLSAFTGRIEKPFTMVWEKRKKKKKKSITCGIVVGRFKESCLLQSNLVPFLLAPHHFPLGEFFYVYASLILN